MMAAKNVDIESLTCPVCCQLFKKPKFLPCHHSYCERCLEKIQVRSKIICPECRKEAIVPPGGVKDLDDNFIVNRLVDELILKRKLESEKTVECDQCFAEDPAVAFCLDCAVFLCEHCLKHHMQSNVSCDHDIVSLAELRYKKDIRLRAAPMMCREHDMELFFYCETCDQLVCIYCITRRHSNHQHDNVKEVIDKHKQELKRITAPVEEMIIGLSDTHEKMVKKIRQQGDEIKNEIDQHYDSLIKQLMDQKEQLKQQVDIAVSQKEKVVTTELEEVQTEVLSVKQLNDVMEKSTDQEVLSVKAQVIDRMKIITDKYNKVCLLPVQQITTEFVPNKYVLPQFGSVCSARPNPHNCEVVDLPKYAIKGKKTEFTIITKDKYGGCCSGGSYVSIAFGQVYDTAQAKDNDDGSYVASFTPYQIGELWLPVLVDGREIKGSPYSVMVKDYTSLNKPSKLVNSEGTPWGIAFSNNNMWAVADWSKHCVYIFDSDDKLVRKIGGQFHYLTAVAFDSDDHLYVADSGNHRVQKFTIDGKHLLKLGSEGSGDGELKFPNGLSIHDGKAYVCDRHNKRISVFQTDGAFDHIIGSGVLGCPFDVTVTSNNQLLIADHDHHCIYRFTLDGDYVNKFGTGVKTIDDNKYTGVLYNPSGITVDFYDFVFVTDTGNHRVSVYSNDGIFIHCFGYSGSIINQFEPYGIAISSIGNIYVSDYSNKRVQIF